MKERNTQRRQGVKQKEASCKVARIAAGSTSAEELYRKIFEHSNDGILVIDPAQDGIVDINPRACAMLGFSRQELLTMPISAIHPDEMPLLRAFAQSVFEDGSGWTNELSCLTKQGQKLPSEISASTIDVAGRSHIIAMVRDITERRKAEEAARELALVEERNRLAREIHDSLAQGFTAIIWQLNAAELPVEGGGEEAVQSLERVRNLARESLQEARRSVWDLRSGPLQRLTLVEVLQQELGKIAEVGIQCAFDVTGKERVLPAGVETALLRISQEALSNVLKYANASQVTINVTYQRARVQLSIRDDGIGFDPQIPSQWDKDRGGFGLISMRERAQLLGGSCRSRVGWAGELLFTRSCQPRSWKVRCQKLRRQNKSEY